MRFLNNRLRTHLRISLASAAENWLKRDILVQTGRSWKSWTMTMRARPKAKRRTYRLYLLQDIFIDLTASLLHSLRWSVRHLRIGKHDTSRTVAFPSHPVDHSFPFLTCLFVNEGRLHRGSIGFETTTENHRLILKQAREMNFADL